jgi:hypothetical protein
MSRITLFISLCLALSIFSCTTHSTSYCSGLSCSGDCTFLVDVVSAKAIEVPCYGAWGFAFDFNGEERIVIDKNLDPKWKVEGKTAVICGIAIPNDYPFLFPDPTLTPHIFRFRDYTID